jgi:hypothetical protein
MERFWALNAYWEKYPPTHIMVRNVALWLGAYKPSNSTVEKITLDQFRAQHPNGIVE